MNLPDKADVSDPAAEQCAAIVRQLDHPTWPRNRVLNTIVWFGLALYWAWMGWQESVPLNDQGGPRVVSMSGAVNVVLAVVSLHYASQQARRSPQDRLLRLLAEDYLARRKTDSATPAQTPGT